MSEVTKRLCHLLTHWALGNGDAVKGKSFIWCSGGISSSGELKPRASRDKYHLYDVLLFDFFPSAFRGLWLWRCCWWWGFEWVCEVHWVPSALTHRSSGKSSLYHPARWNLLPLQIFAWCKDSNSTKILSKQVLPQRISGAGEGERNSFWHCLCCCFFRGTTTLPFHSSAWLFPLIFDISHCRGRWSKQRSLHHAQGEGKRPPESPQMGAGWSWGFVSSWREEGQGWWHCQHAGDSSSPWPTASTGRKGFCQQHKAEFSWQEGTKKSSQKVHEDLTFPLEKKRKGKKEQEKDFLEMSWLLKYSLWSLPPPWAEGLRKEEHPQELQWLYLWEEGLTDPAGLFQTRPRSALKHWLFSLFSSTARALLCWQTWSRARRPCPGVNPSSRGGMGEAAPRRNPARIPSKRTGRFSFPAFNNALFLQHRDKAHKGPFSSCLQCPKLSPREWQRGAAQVFQVRWEKLTLVVFFGGILRIKGGRYVRAQGLGALGTSASPCKSWGAKGCVMSGQECRGFPGLLKAVMEMDVKFC